MKKNYFKLSALTVLFTVFLSNKNHAQDTYTVEAIPFQQYSTSQPIEFTIDDKYSDVLTIPFNFTFFEQEYNQFLVSTNGYIDFRTELANENSPWSFNMSIPNTGFPVKNSILGCYHDMDNSSGVGTITWSVTGNAPYRQFVLLYNNQPHFSASCNTTAFSSFQVILYETVNFIDVQIIKKDLCTEWQGGYAVVGVINDTGTEGYAPPLRNTGAWTVTEGAGEGWRFKPQANPDNTYKYIKCDTDADGIETFDFNVILNDINSSAVLYSTYEDAEAESNALSGTGYTNAVPFELTTIYARYNDIIIPVSLSMVDCGLAFDNDNVPTADEDLNQDGNLANDDTDGDGLPDFIDNDDDGDLILTSEEYVFGRDVNDMYDTDGDGIPNYLDNDDDGDGILTINEEYNGNNYPADDDTDEDGIPDYLDNDDDGDGILTIDEDYNQNGDPTDDDLNGNNIPDYLDAEAQGLGINENDFNKSITIYPNPTNDVLNINNLTGKEITEVTIYSINGVKVKQLNTANQLDIKELQTGIYILKITIDNQSLTYKLIKN
ncbi:T9SS type A sorting domain-containing protein [Flavobacterium alkalisoli]|uniref:T9SS type A sorting domain-containing protein n=1 Tax=Flavobacterium alkalisoli TaxID=2602769 RepID=A0A5B9FV21_9FLAO|nr:T9SS type A sorting domain-containing protein [Flavobacterium alkalisoli]QEE50830.1 T9SS type A sorting domain-containing protein [Flavobacterium alkalisoli]